MNYLNWRIEGEANNCTVRKINWICKDLEVGTEAEYGSHDCGHFSLHCSSEIGTACAAVQKLFGQFGEEAKLVFTLLNDKGEVRLDRDLKPAMLARELKSFQEQYGIADDEITECYYIADFHENAAAVFVQQ